MTDNKDIGWMYEGAKSLVNREDYLLGKKVDKNFEKYSDAVNEQKPDAFEALLHTRTVSKPQPSSTKTSALETYVVATEDPLVAVKVKEETRRREVLENPLVKLKFQKMLKEMMAEKESKGNKKKKKKKKKAEDVEKPKKQKKKKKSRESSEKDVSTKSSPKRKHLSPQRNHGHNFDREPKPLQRRSSSAERNAKRSKSMEHQHKRRSRRSRSRSKESRLRRSTSSSSVDAKEKTLSSAKGSSRSKGRRNSSSSPSEGDRRSRNSTARRDRGHMRSTSKEREQKYSSARSNRRRTPSPRLSRSSGSARKRRHSSASVSPKRKEERRASKTRTETSRDAKKERSRGRNRTSSSSSETSSSSSSRSVSPENRGKVHSKENQYRGSHSSFVKSSKADDEKLEESDDHKPGEACTSEQKETEMDKLRTFDSHIPEHLRPKGSATGSEDEIEDHFDREERERKKRFEGFGLVGAKKKDDESGPTENPYELSRKPALPVYQKSERRRPLTEEEKQAKLREMAENAAWRQATRKSNLKRAQLAEEKEDEEDMKDKAPSFIRSQLNSAASDLTVEQRLQSNKKSLQRSHGYMEKKFTSK